MDRRALRRFAKYSGIGFTTFIFDLFLLWLFIDGFGMPVLPATGVAFLIAVSLNFLISRRYVFRGSARTLQRGYAYFMSYAVAGALLTTLLMWLLTELTGLHYALVRVLIAIFVGVGNYAANLYLNFKVAGMYH